MAIKNKILSLPALLKKLPALRRQGKIIAWTNGCFDLMHIGHVKYLEEAGRGNRILIVGLNSDISTRKLKGSNRPIVPQKSRAAVLAALESVDFVVIFNEETPHKIISVIKPDILIKGADYKGKSVVGEDLVKKVEFIKFVKGFSTTNIIEKIVKSEKNPDRSLYRILDANFNRTKEGLRVCEDLCRYVWDQTALTRAFKDLRHELTAVIAGLDIQKVLEARHIQGDVGRTTTVSETKRKDINAVFYANAQRVKESLRVLEEVTKLMDAKIASRVKALRYKVYALEQKVIGRG